MSVWTQLVEEIEDFTRDIRELPVIQPVAPAEIRADLGSRYTFDRPLPLEEVAADVMRLFRRWNVQVTHPRYFGLFNPSVRQAGILADALAALYNPQLAAWSHAPAANEIERLVLSSLARLLGFDPETILANFTTGGAEANLSAVLAALFHHFPDSEESGIAGLPHRPAIYLTSETHHSFLKIARITGLGTGALHTIPTGPGYLLDIEALERRIEAGRQQGWHPLMVVGTAGSTGAGLIDPLDRIARAAQRGGAWFHVDAAWGGAAALSPRLRPALAGIELADSVTWDAHKWLSAPMGAGMFFCRHPEAAKRAFAISTSYMPGESGEETYDPYSATLQWSRRAIGLKVFMSLAELGLDGYHELVERQADMGDQLRQRLRQSGWIIRNETPLPVVCFTHPEIQAGRQTPSRMLETIYRRGRVWISEVLVGGQERLLRACITSFRTDEADLDCLMEELEIALKENP